MSTFYGNNIGKLLKNKYYKYIIIYWLRGKVYTEKNEAFVLKIWALNEEIKLL